MSDCGIDIIYILVATVGRVGTVLILFEQFEIAKNGMFRFTLSALFVMVQWTGLLTMLSLVVDLLLRVKKPLQYSQLMSKKRGNTLITCIWTLCIIFSFGVSDVFTIIGYYDIVFYLQVVLLHVIILLSFVAFCVINSCILCGIRGMPSTIYVVMVRVLEP